MKIKMFKLMTAVSLVASFSSSFALASYSYTIERTGSAVGTDERAAEEAYGNAFANIKSECLARKCSVCPDVAEKLPPPDFRKRNSEEWETMARAKLDVSGCEEDRPF